MDALCFRLHAEVTDSADGLPAMSEPHLVATAFVTNSAPGHPEHFVAARVPIAGPAIRLAADRARYHPARFAPAPVMQRPR